MHEITVRLAILSGAGSVLCNASEEAAGITLPGCILPPGESSRDVAARLAAAAIGFDPRAWYAGLAQVGFLDEEGGGKVVLYRMAVPEQVPPLIAGLGWVGAGALIDRHFHAPACRHTQLAAGAARITHG